MPVQDGQSLRSDNLVQNQGLFSFLAMRVLALGHSIPLTMTPPNQSKRIHYARLYRTTSFTLNKILFFYYPFFRFDVTIAVESGFLSEIY
jgi:hypothetical protein